MSLLRYSLLASKESANTAVASAKPLGKDFETLFRWESPVFSGFPLDDPMQISPLFLQSYVLNSHLFTP
jgi:hypothetical protein